MNLILNIMTVYIKHYIKSEADLPKKDGYYLICFKRLKVSQMDYTLEYCYKGIKSEKRDILKNALYWLEEIELPTDDEIDEQIDKYAFRVPYDGSNEFYDEIALKHYQAGINWLKSKLR
jgi:hypothetical protein